MNLTEEQIETWAKAPSETEDARCTNAISQTTNALRAHFGNSVTFIRQGSHTNRTNIRVDSDVDLAVVHNGYYFPDTTFLSAADKALHGASFSPATYTFFQYKSEVEAILRATFGTNSVERKAKCLRVAGNTNRTPIDIVPAFEHHRLSAPHVVSAKGIEFLADSGPQVYSFPEQHYQNGVTKNDNTSRTFKSMVRILKRTRGRLAELGLIEQDAMPSFMLECLVWNVPNPTFRQATWRDIAAEVTAKIWNDMQNPEVANNYAEVCDLRWLFRGNPRHTPAQVEAFMLQAWRLITQ
ncbi:MAG TPA: nucleotidyltransferase [Rhizomicrobium sp.]|nr:nucleotidyltransferase [Rhizomicrobium sp.]